ncbi:MAG TPA: aspartate aminotransferase family protein [Acidimicrobiales bacterium]|nr:aspartate aminotransferase family protein [Acidimicrobiales bacterium]
MTTHDELLARHRRVLPNWIALNYERPIALVEGRGRHVVDAEGHRYLDFFGGILTTSIGHNVPEIVEATRAQLSRIVHTSTLYLIEQQIELAERIAGLSGIPEAKVFFTNSGTEANEAALLLATTARRSNQVLALRNSYHGRSFAAMGVTGNRNWSASTFSPLAVSLAPSPYRYRSPYAALPEEAFLAACVADLRELVATGLSGDLAAVIVEPIQGVGGFIVPPQGYFAALKEVTDELGATFISDEVQTGWGRTGESYFGISADGVRPDAMTFAKGLANGLPIGGVVAGAQLMDSVSVNSISTFGGNPLVTATALATLDYIERHDLQGNARARGGELLEALGRLFSPLDTVGEVRGKGLMAAVEFVLPGTRTPAPALAAAALEGARERGLLIGKGGLYGNVLRIAPPLSVTAAEIAEAAGILEGVVAGLAEPATLR